MHLVSCPMNKCFDALAVLVNCTNLEVALRMCAHLVEHSATIKQEDTFMSVVSRPQRRCESTQADRHNRCNL